MKRNEQAVFAAANQMERLAEKHGIRLFTSHNHVGGIFTTPGRSAWPADMVVAIEEFMTWHRGLDADYWTVDGGDEDEE